MRNDKPEVVVSHDLGEVWVNGTGVEDISTVLDLLPSTVTEATVERSVVTDDEGGVSEWLIFKTG